MFNLVPWKRKEKEENGSAIATRESNPLVRFREEVDALFDRFFHDGPHFDRLWKGWPAAAEKDWSVGWSFDVDDGEKELVVRAEAPGFDPDDFDVQVCGNHLIIGAEHKQESKKKDQFTCRYGAFRRVVPLPDGIEKDKIDARYRRGVLQVNVPKGERARGKQITVKAS